MPVCEDLATKDELQDLKDEVQELRDQLNTVLGEDESGAVKKVFEIGSTAKEAKDTAELAIWGLTKLRAAGALTDIRQAVTSFLPGSTNLAKGASQWVKVAGNGATKPMINLDKISTIAGKGSAASKLGSKVAGNSLAGLSILSDLVQLQGTLAINIGTVKVLDKRIEAEARGARLQIDTVNDGLLRLYEKNNGDITLIKNYLDLSIEQLTENVTKNTFTGQELDQLKEDVKNLEPDLDKVWAAINDLRTKNTQTKTEINELKNDLDEVADELLEAVNKTDEKIEKVTQVIEDIKSQIEKILEEIDLIKARLTELEERVTKAEEDIQKLKDDLDTLEEDLRADIRLNEARSKSNAADIILLTKKISKQTFEGIQQKYKKEIEEGEEEVDNADIEELKQYINDKVTALLEAQFTEKIEPAVKVIEDEIKHDDYGLEKIQDFADTAWESTQNDKAMNATTLAFCIHNALMLSSNLPSTISEASNLSYGSLQIKDQTGELYKTSEAVSGKTQALLANLASPEAQASLTSRIGEKSRTYQANANVLQTNISLFDSAKSISELTFLSLGQIGNALKDSGVVYEDAYRIMPVEIDSHSIILNRLELVRDETVVIGDEISIIDDITSEVLKRKQHYDDLKGQKASWELKIEQSLLALEEETAEIKEASSVTADIDDLDFERGESN